MFWVRDFKFLVLSAWNTSSLVSLMAKSFNFFKTPLLESWIEMLILFTLPKTIFTSKNPSLSLSLQRQRQHQHHPSHHPLPSLLCFILLCVSSAHILIYLVVTFHSWNVIFIPLNHQHIKVPLVNCKYSRWYWRDKYKNERVPTCR